MFCLFLCFLSFVRSWQRPTWPKRPASVVIDSGTYLLTISLPNITNIAMSLSASLTNWSHDNSFPLPGLQEVYNVLSEQLVCSNIQGSILSISTITLHYIASGFGSHDFAHCVATGVFIVVCLFTVCFGAVQCEKGILRISSPHFREQVSLSKQSLLQRSLLFPHKTYACPSVWYWMHYSTTLGQKIYSTRHKTCTVLIKVVP